jgi:hypothetical protein
MDTLELQAWATCLRFKPIYVNVGGTPRRLCFDGALRQFVLGGRAISALQAEQILRAYPHRELLFMEFLSNIYTGDFIVTPAENHFPDEDF